MSKPSPDQPLKPCGDVSQSWFAGAWRDWHRGHGCSLDDGRPRTDAGWAEINAYRGLPANFRPALASSAPAPVNQRVAFCGGGRIGPDAKGCGAALVYEHSANGIEYWRCPACGNSHWWKEDDGEAPAPVTVPADLTAILRKIATVIEPAVQYGDPTAAAVDAIVFAALASSGAAPPQPVCDCGERLTQCSSCAQADWQAAHPTCPQCCPPVKAGAAPPASPITADERELLHAIIEDCDSLIDPEQHPELSARINAVLANCDGGCVPPASPAPSAPPQEPTT